MKNQPNPIGCHNRGNIPDYLRMVLSLNLINLIIFISSLLSINNIFHYLPQINRL